jgi:hypothetical protein
MVDFYCALDRFVERSPTLTTTRMDHRRSLRQMREVVLVQSPPDANAKRYTLTHAALSAGRPQHE